MKNEAANVLRAKLHDTRARSYLRASKKSQNNVRHRIVTPSHQDFVVFETWKKAEFGSVLVISRCSTSRDDIVLTRKPLVEALEQRDIIHKIEASAYLKNGRIEHCPWDKRRGKQSVPIPWWFLNSLEQDQDNINLSTIIGTSKTASIAFWHTARM